MFEIDSKFVGSTASRTIRFNEELFETLNQLAQENNISFNSLVLQCCNYALDNLKKEE